MSASCNACLPIERASQQAPHLQASQGDDLPSSEAFKYPNNLADRSKAVLTQYVYYLLEHTSEIREITERCAIVLQRREPD
jgi:hypothetical protein